MRKHILYIAFFFGSFMTLNAQTFGVRAGLNYSTFNGPTLEEESYGFSNGFHFGINYAYDFTDLFALRFEILYIQNGNTYDYNGESFYVIRDTPSGTIFERGNLELSLNNSNAYLSIPIIASYKLNRKWEVFGGGFFNLLVGPTGRGQLRFASNSRPEDILFRQSLDYRYNSQNLDQIRGNFLGPLDDISIRVNGDIVTLPRFAGAHTQLGTYLGNKYSRIDYGLTLGFNYFLNKGFFIGLRGEYGLNDLTNNNVDYNQSMLDEENNFIFSNDRDTHLGIQASFGFRF